MILVLNGIQKLDTDLNVHKSISILRLCIMRTLAMHKAQNHSVVCTIRQNYTLREQPVDILIKKLMKISIMDTTIKC